MLAGRDNWQFCCAVVLLLAAGCGGPSFPTAKLAGVVTVDGEPVAEGTLSFTPLEGNRGPGAPVPIKAGRYESPATPKGKLRVDFYAVKQSGKMVEEYGKMVPEVVSAIPERYRTGMEIEVTGDNPQQDFALTTKAP